MTFFVTAGSGVPGKQKKNLLYKITGFESSS
jgi:hypothetical protein